MKALQDQKGALSWDTYEAGDFVPADQCRCTCWQHVGKTSKILKKLHCFATFCLTQTHNVPVESVVGGELWTDPSSQRKKF